MSQNYTICIGSVGGGLSCSPDGGDTWNRIRTPLPSECNVRALHVYPDGSKRILAGTDRGMFRSEDNGNTWKTQGSVLLARCPLWIPVAVANRDSGNTGYTASSASRIR